MCTKPVTFQAQRDQISELLWEILTHNSEDRKYPLDDLVEMVHAYKGNPRLLGDALVEAFREAASYKGVGLEDEPEVVDPFFAMKQAIAIAHAGR